MVDYVHTYGGNTKTQRQGIREIKTAATTTLGDVKPLGLGREVIYAKVSSAAAIAAGHVVLAPAQVANHSNVVVNITASIGATSVTICAGATAITRDQYKDGFLLVNDAVGEGYSYVIEGHASASSGSGVEITLKDGLEVALTTASEVTLVSNPCMNVVEGFASAALTAQPIGVTLGSVAATDASYVYLGKRGMWPTVVGSSCATGADAYLSSGGVTEKVTANTTANQAYLGSFGSTAAATEYCMVNFKL
jgi:hypothetical protein